MEASQRRTQALARIKERVGKTIPHRLDDRQTLQLAIASSMRESAEILGFLFSNLVAKAAATQLAQNRLTAAEWRDLFGCDMPPLRDASVVAIVQSADFRQPEAAIASALRTTVQEQQQAACFRRAWNKALCYVASHLHDPNASLEAVLGSIVRSDLRRLEELHASIDDDGCDTILMSKLIISLSDGVV